jgi:hypothetical protein
VVAHNKNLLAKKGGIMIPPAITELGEVSEDVDGNDTQERVLLAACSVFFLKYIRFYPNLFRVELQSYIIASLPRLSIIVGLSRNHKSVLQNTYLIFNMSHLKFYTSPGVPESMLESHHYSQAVRVGDLIQLSGQGTISPSFLSSLPNFSLT